MRVILQVEKQNNGVRLPYLTGTDVVHVLIGPGLLIKGNLERVLGRYMADNVKLYL